jgi:hypothetical protein
MPQSPRLTAASGASYPTAQWVIAVLLAFIAGVLWTRTPSGGVSTALAQNPQLVGARGVYAFTGQLDQNRFGLFMLDIEQGTVWCYEIDNVGGVRKLRLIAARSWVYDRYLRDFNCTPPDFREVQELVAQQRTMSATGTSGTAPDEGGSPSPTAENPPDKR